MTTTASTCLPSLNNHAANQILKPDRAPALAICASASWHDQESGALISTKPNPVLLVILHGRRPVDQHGLSSPSLLFSFPPRNRTKQKKYQQKNTSGPSTTEHSEEHRLHVRLLRVTCRYHHGSFEEPRGPFRFMHVSCLRLFYFPHIPGSPADDGELAPLLRRNKFNAFMRNRLGFFFRDLSSLP